MMEKSSIPYDTMSAKSISTESMYSKCCCCIPIRIGCFILGYMNLIVNSIRSLFLMGIAVFFGIKTHGFDHADPVTTVDKANETYEHFLDRAIGSLDTQTIQVLGWTLVAQLIFDLIWLTVNIACLVGIHKKRPGPIRAYVGFAIFRLILTLVGYMYQMYPIQSGGTMYRCIDLSLTTYFIFVYYIYAMRLDKEARETVTPQVHHVHQVQVNDIAYIYPTKLDKEHLVV